MSIQEWYIFFLVASESTLRWWIDAYNRGLLDLAGNASIALETIDGLPIDD